MLLLFFEGCQRISLSYWIRESDSGARLNERIARLSILLYHKISITVAALRV